VELILAALVTVLAAASSRLLSDEFKAWTPWIVERLIRSAERGLPAKYRERLGEEWRRHVTEVPGDLGKLITACGFFRASKTIRASIRPTTTPYGRLLASFALVFMAPLLLFIFTVLMSAQRRWPLVRVKRRVWGQEVEVWNFRLADENGDFRMFTDLPMLYDIVRGRVRLPSLKATVAAARAWLWNREP
jgi:hypothetical protein